MTVYNSLQLAHCRFCKRHEIGSNVRSRMVKYGVRHYAHFNCFLDAGKDLFRLSRWQVDQFPPSLLKKHGLTEKVESTKRVGNLIGNW